MIILVNGHRSGSQEKGFESGVLDCELHTQIRLSEFMVQDFVQLTVDNH